MLPIASLLGTTWIVNELFYVEHTYEIVSVIEEDGETKYGMSKLDLDGGIVKGLVVVSARQLHQIFLQTEAKP